MEPTTSTPQTAPESPHQGKPDLSSFLERERQELRAQFQVRPLTADERRMSEDVRWALRDASVQAHYRREVVVPYERRVVAHGHHAAQVLAEAARVTGRKVEELPLVSVIDSLLEISH